VALSASPASLTANGSSTASITATVRNSAGIALPNIQVALSTTLGNLSATSATTNSAGSIQASLRAGTSVGIATVVAQAGGVSNSIQVGFTAGPAAQLTDIGSNPSAPAPGSTALLQARVRDAFGNPVSGVQVTFTLIQNQSGSGFTSAEDTSDSMGLALVSYPAGNTSGVDILRVTASGISSDNQLVLNIAPGDNSPASISLGADPETITANGNSTAVIVATVRNSSGIPVPNVQVALSADLGTLSTVSATTNSAGTVQATLRSGPFAGTATVAALAGGISNSIQIEFTAGPPAQITDIAANPAAPAPGSTALLQARVRDAHGNPVSGIQVSFTLIQNQSGSDFSTGQTDTDSAGLALVSYAAGPNSGTDVLRITAQGIATDAQLALEVSPGSATGPASIALSADPMSIAADGASTSVITATVRNSSGVLLPNVQVALSTSLGAISPASAATTSAGTIQATLRSGTMAGMATVVAQAGGLSNSVQVEFFAGAPAQITDIASNPAAPAPGANALLQARVRDAFGNPVAGVQLTFTLIQNQSGTSFTSAQEESDSAGLAMVSYLAGPNNGIDILRITAEGLATEAQLVLNIGPGSDTTPAGVTLSADPASITADGLSTAAIAATVVNSSGIALPGIPVTLSASLGALSATSTTTNAAGTAQVSLQAGTTAGISVIVAQAGGVTGSLQVAFAAGPPAQITELGSIPSDPEPGETLLLQARIRDAFGNPISVAMARARFADRI